MNIVASAFAVLAVVTVPAGAVIYLHQYVDDAITEVSTSVTLQRRIELTELEIKDKEYQLNLILERAQAGRALKGDPRRRQQLEKDLERLQDRLEKLRSI